MIATDKVLHTANLLVCSAGVASAAGALAIATSAVSGILSLREISKRLPPDLKPLRDAIAQSLRQNLTQSHLPEAQVNLILQMIEFGLPDAEAIMQADRNAAKVVDAMLKRLDDTSADPAHKDPMLRSNFAMALTPVLKDLLGDPGYAKQMEAAFQSIVVQALAEMAARLDKLIAQTSDKARELKLTEKLFIGLARRINTSVADIDAAYDELEYRIEIAAEMERQASLPSNHGAQIDAVLKEVTRLNAEDSLDDAADVIAQGLAELEAQEQEMRAKRLTLLDLSIEQERLRGNPEAVAKRELEKLEIEVPDRTARFVALWQVQDVWNERGRDKGLNFDLEVAIALAEACGALAEGPDQRGVGLGTLGTALATLGQRESGTARLEQAVEAYQTALLELTRERVPLEWARTQNNLGNALWTLGERENGTARLEQAVEAYRNALQEMTRERVPLDWAMTQMGLGNALQTLGARESGTARLEQAVAAYRNTLLEMTRERVPLDWAITQVNLGAALAALGQRESGTARLEQAVEAYQNALLERTRERVPLDWAMTQNNLGNALATLGERESSTARLEQAVAAYQSALLEMTRERVPLDWAMTQMNLGTALQTLGERESDTARLEEAVVAYRNALLERTRERVPLDWATTQMNLGNTLLALGERESGTARLEEAVAAYQNALLERTRERVPLYWASTQFNMALVELAFAAKTEGAAAEAHLRAALADVEAALEVFSPESTPYDHGTATRLRDGILSRL